MPLTPGTRLGPYEIKGLLGEGGMGEVYRAHDTKLDRSVALKILPDVFAQDADRLARFEREARTLASLNHPNVAQVYDADRISGTAYLVMELVEGEDLSALIARGPMPSADVLPIAKQIALGLEAAHEVGVIHRDLKPANIKVRADGTVKVLDFGLAKALDPAAASSTAVMNSPTLTNRGTEAGIILGTAAYMSPEQAKGRSVDKRADIWAFGVVLHEMLTGSRAFNGESVAETLGLIFAREPGALLKELPARTPATLRTLVARCLVKDPRERLRDIGDGRQLIDEAIAARVEVGPEPGVSARWTRPVPLAGILIAIASLASAITWSLMRPTAAVTPLIEFSAALPSDVSVRRGTGGGLAISPDGRVVVYVAEPVGGRARALYLKRLDSIGSTLIAGTEGAFAPFFSPDNLWIGFFTDQQIMRVPVAGGTPTPITPKGRYSRATWMKNGSIVLGTSSAFRTGALAIVPVTGGTPKDLTTLGAGETLHQLPYALPDGRHVIFSVHDPTGGGHLAVTDIGGGTHRLLGPSGSDPRYVEPGTLLFARGLAMFEAPFDPGTVQVTGPEAAIFPDAQVGDFGMGISVALFDVDRAGNAVYVAKATERSTELAWVDSSGKRAPVGLESGLYARPRISRDGGKFVVQSREGIRIVDVMRGLPLDLEVVGVDPLWGPDGSIAYAVTRPTSPGTGGLFRVAADKSAPPAKLLGDPERLFVPEDWAQDGRLVLSSSPRAGTRGLENRDVEVLVPGSEPRPLLNSPADESGARISPDSQWLAYQAASSGRSRVYVRPFDRAGGTQTVSGEGGANPVWARDGRALFFIEGQSMMKAAVTLSPFAIGKRAALFPLSAPAISFDVAPDGHFLIVFSNTASLADELRIVLGWSRNPRRR